MDVISQCLWLRCDIFLFSNIEIFGRSPVFGSGGSLVRLIIRAVSSVFIIILESRNRPIVVNLSGRAASILFIGFFAADAEYLLIFLLDLSNFILICDPTGIRMLGVCGCDVVKMRKGLTSQGKLLIWLIVSL